MGDQKWCVSWWEIVAITPNIPANAFKAADAAITKQLVWATKTRPIYLNASVTG